MMRSKRLAMLVLVLAGACGAQTSENDLRVDRPPGPIRTVKPSAAELERELTPLQYKVTQQSHTEPPFRNAYWDHHAAGLYVDITTGQPLFTSNEKFDSGTGWPSFFRPIDGDAVVENRDTAYGMERVEVRSTIGDAHLGHVFDDGPRPTGLRYCINSASLRFIAVADLEARGYATYKPLFRAAPVGRFGPPTP